MSFWGSFTGSDQKSAIKKASKQAMGYLDAGAEQARGEFGQYYDQAQGYLAPYLQGGGQANNLLANYLGVNGADAQSQAFADFQNDPGYQQQFNAGVNALDRSATARGGLYSGAAMKGLQEYGQQFQRQAYNDRISQLSGFAGQGLQAGSAAAGLASNQGNQLGNLSFGLGQQKASNAINKGNALASASGIGWQNALNLAGTAAKAWAASDIRVKRDIENIGELPSGLPVYRFKYLWDDAEHVGVMAQEAIEKFPDAVREFDGVLHVDYSRIG